MLELVWLLLTIVVALGTPAPRARHRKPTPAPPTGGAARPTRTRRHGRLRTWDKLLWIVARRFCTGWREHLSFLAPETIVLWHRQGRRLLWRWKSRSRRGRPHLSPNVRDLIGTMSRENSLWGPNG